MAVMLTTSLGDIVIDLHPEQCPLAAKNFLKLCKIKYYNNCLFHMVQKDFIAQTGDPSGTGSGGDSIYKSLYGEQARFFNDEIHPDLKHNKVGTVAMASAGENLNASQFYITLRDDLDYLDGKHTIFGEVGEGLETLQRINEAYVDEKGRPYKNIRIKHTYILDDPFEDPPQLLELVPERSPELGAVAEGEEVRLEDDWIPLDEQLGQEELEKSLRRKEAQSRAVVLEMVGDIPEAEIKPPENVLFVCKLNPVTQEEDLEIIFSRFGKIISADIIRDYKTGDSLCYAFIEFETQEACEAAYFKMDNVLIDDRRIHVDFSQSVSKLWTRYRRFGKRDKGDGEGTTLETKGGHGCYKCGEVGHFVKDCPNQSMNQAAQAQERPKYKLRDTEGQHGEGGKRYDMLFEDPSDEANKHAQTFKNGDSKYYRERSLDEERSRWSRRDSHRSKEDQRTRDSSYKHVMSEKRRERERHADRTRHFDQIHGQGKEKIHDERLHKERQSGRYSSRDDEPGVQRGLGETGNSRDGHDDIDEKQKRRRVSPRREGHSTSKQNDREDVRQETRKESARNSKHKDRHDERQKASRVSPIKEDRSSRHYERGDEGREARGISSNRHSRRNDVGRRTTSDSHGRRMEGSSKDQVRDSDYGKSHQGERSSKDHHSRRTHDKLEREHSRHRREEKRVADDSE